MFSAFGLARILLPQLAFLQYDMNVEQRHLVGLDMKHLHLPAVICRTRFCLTQL